MLFLLGGLVLLGATETQAQAIQFLDCVQVAFLQDGCAEDATSPPTHSTTPVPPAPPLFTKESVARDTPPILLQMLQHPEHMTLDQARLFVAQQQRKQQIFQQAQALIQQAQAEWQRLHGK
jgi:hypothetical protein